MNLSALLRPVATAAMLLATVLATDPPILLADERGAGSRWSRRWPSVAARAW